MCILPFIIFCGDFFYLPTLDYEIIKGIGHVFLPPSKPNTVLPMYLLNRNELNHQYIIPAKSALVYKYVTDGDMRSLCDFHKDLLLSFLLHCHCILFGLRRGNISFFLG